MLNDRVEAKWIDVFERAFRLSEVADGMEVAILSETQSRSLNVQLAELALVRIGAKPFHIILPTPRLDAPVPVRSTGSSVAIDGNRPVIERSRQPPSSPTSRSRA